MEESAAWQDDIRLSSCKLLREACRAIFSITCLPERRVTPLLTEGGDVCRL